MPEPIRMSRPRVAAWAVQCAAGLAATTTATATATAKLNASSAPDPQPDKPVSAECAQYVADIEMQLAKTKQEGTGDGVLAFSRVKAGTDDDCRAELRKHFRGDR
ncbi:membrane protein [Streptomyces sp. WM6372]|uniref:hypothetical protein n=1 Tax=Streptomyces sp. WM6372 TaxID=1415555 RepID=UPI0006AE6148|nr:hypothetical protein [Streptomyces sp. WM6372]KOU26432.1 membrane protein [Streptomyces sp. WM6372]